MAACSPDMGLRMERLLETSDYITEAAATSGLPPRPMPRTTSGMALVAAAADAPAGKKCAELWSASTLEPAATSSWAHQLALPSFQDRTWALSAALALQRLLLGRFTLRLGSGLTGLGQ